MREKMTRRTGDTATRRTKKSPRLCVSASSGRSGFTLLELIVTLTVLAILVMGTIPLAQNAVKRQKELRLRETLREIRAAIDEFKRDTNGACPQGAVSNNVAGLGGATNIPPDPRSRVVIDDCTIFDNENLDRYPPSLDILVEGVKVKARGANIRTNTAFSETDATDLAEEKELKKVYLRSSGGDSKLPIDPMTGEADWVLRSSYQTEDSGSWDDINVFDIRSSSDEEAFNGEKYSDW